MSQKTPPDGDDTRLVAIIHQETMKKIEELAEQLGVEPLDVVVELIRLEASKRPEGVTLH